MEHATSILTLLEFAIAGAFVLSLVYLFIRGSWPNGNSQQGKLGQHR